MKLNFTMWRFKGEALRIENKAGGILYGIWYVMVIYHWNFLSTDRSISRHCSFGRKSGRRQADFSCCVKSTQQKTQAAQGRPTAKTDRTAGKVCTLECFWITTHCLVYLLLAAARSDALKCYALLFFSALSLFVCWCCLGLSCGDEC